MIKQAQAEKWLEKLKPILRIQDWDISITVLPLVEYNVVTADQFDYETHGITEIRNDHDVFIIIRSDLSREDFITTLIHECVHLVTHSYDEFVRNTLTHVDSRKIAKVFKNEALWEMEILVSRITTILKPILKL